MRYAALKKNDIANAPGVCVSFYVQGCRGACPGCHNPETWDFDGGKKFTPQVLEELLQALTANNVHRDLCILGGEPLCEENLFLTDLIITEVKNKLPDTKIYVWTGYIYENLKSSSNPYLKTIFNTIDYLIDGPYIEAQRDITLLMRGSKNQRIIDIKEKKVL